MSFQLMAWAVEQTTGSGTRKAVLLALANAANHHTGLCCPRISALAEETELGERTVKRALDDLEQLGFIARSRRRRQDGSLGTYDYSFPGAALAPSPSSLQATPAPDPQAALAPQEPRSRTFNQEDLKATYPSHGEFLAAELRQEIELEVEKLAKIVKGGSREIATLRMYARGLPLASVARVRESCERHDGPVGVGYAIRALQSEIAERRSA